MPSLKARRRWGAITHRARVCPAMAHRGGLAALVACLLLALLDPWAAASAGGHVTSGVSGQSALHVIPFPGTPDASPRSQIIFSSLRRSDLRLVTVTGSSSGSHRGRLQSLPDQAGTAFIPAHPFTPGEKVTVLALLTSPGAGTASGDPGAHSLTFSFSVAVSAAGLARTGSHAGSSRSTPGPFHSERYLNPPPVADSTPPAPGPGDIFLSPYAWAAHSPYQSGLMILNHRGQLVWFRRVLHGEPFNLAVQRYRGRPVLTWWQGYMRDHSTVDGHEVILSTSYRRLAVVHPAYGYSADLHEFQITPQGTALIAANVPVKANLSSVGGPSDGWLDDCIIQELDIRTGQLLWEWHALGHVPLSAVESPQISGNYDAYFHFNSAQQLPGHRLLISSRNTWSVYEINELTGRVIWTLGGRYSSFKMARGTSFEFQHDAHLYGHGLLTLLDDAAAPQEESESSAKTLRINLHTRTVSLVSQFTHSPPLLATAEGSAQLLRNGDMFVGWGDTTSFSQYTASGHQIFNATFPLGVNSYRAYRFAWTGHPVARPAVSLSRSSKGARWVYVSWNGATQVARWRVLGGSTPNTLKPLKTKRWSGFETAMALRSTARYLVVQALSQHGRVLGHSGTMTAASG